MAPRRANASHHAPLQRSTSRKGRYVSYISMVTVIILMAVTLPEYLHRGRILGEVLIDDAFTSDAITSGSPPGGATKYLFYGNWPNSVWGECLDRLSLVDLLRCAADEASLLNRTLVLPSQLCVATSDKAAGVRSNGSSSSLQPSIVLPTAQIFKAKILGELAQKVIYNNSREWRSVAGRKPAAKRVSHAMTPLDVVNMRDSYEGSEILFRNTNLWLLVYICARWVATPHERNGQLHHIHKERGPLLEEDGSRHSGGQRETQPYSASSEAASQLPSDTLMGAVPFVGRLSAHKKKSRRRKRDIKVGTQEEARNLASSTEKYTFVRQINDENDTEDSLADGKSEKAAGRLWIKGHDRGKEHFEAREEDMGEEENMQASGTSGDENWSSGTEALDENEDEVGEAGRQRHHLGIRRVRESNQLANARGKKGVVSELASGVAKNRESLGPNWEGDVSAPHERSAHSRKSWSAWGRKSGAKSTHTRFVLYRIIGNDMPPLQSVGQLRWNTEYLLKHEGSFEGCQKRWVLNRIANTTEKFLIEDLLRSHGYRRDQIVDIPFDVDKLVDESNESEKITLNPILFRGKGRSIGASEEELQRIGRRIRDFMGLNNGRNMAIEDGVKAGFRWILCFDANQFVPNLTWHRIRDLARRADRKPHVRYIEIPMVRAREEQNPSWLHAESSFREIIAHSEGRMEEGQLIFRNDSTERFNENMAYSLAPKQDLLDRTCTFNSTICLCHDTVWWWTLKTPQAMAARVAPCGVTVRLWSYPEPEAMVLKDGNARRDMRFKSAQRHVTHVQSLIVSRRATMDYEKKARTGQILSDEG
eukprot:TRINITY_DN39006_c0_g1_i1.p1 TRINITY_DN39006_c0_g1~~TRINITY_DN39006_c0_g1_i1.p1  ORF type:complete len:819 (-),score=93.28 TRINITY_DN39006_c0_g1_i1:164-2620(-)